MVHCMHPQPRNSSNAKRERERERERDSEAYIRGMESAPGVDSVLLSVSAPAAPLLLRSIPSYRPFRVPRSPRQAHPLKEDDRLEDTQAPSNGFVLLASIGINRKPPVVHFAERRRWRRRKIAWWACFGKISGHGYIKFVVMHEGNKYRAIFRPYDRPCIFHRRRRMRRMVKYDFETLEDLRPVKGQGTMSYRTSSCWERRKRDGERCRGLITRVSVRGYAAPLVKWGL